MGFKESGKMKYLYESHLGNWYVLDRYEEPEYCEQRGDCDRYLGSFENNKEIAIELFKRDATSEGIEDLTGLKIHIEFEEVQDDTKI